MNFSYLAPYGNPPPKSVKYTKKTVSPPPLFSHPPSRSPSCWHTSTIEPDNQLGDNEPVPSNDKFKIVIVLDESGSMSSIRNDMKESINDLIMEQKQIKERPATFTLVKFNHNVSRVYANKSLEEVTSLSNGDYTPSGTTALYDAIGDTVNWFRYEKDVLMVIVTDGQENASQKYNKSKVTQMIEEKKKNRGWSYVYLSCDLETASQGDGISLKKSKVTSNCRVEKSGYGNFMKGHLNSAIGNYRKNGVSVQEQLNVQY